MRSIFGREHRNHGNACISNNKNGNLRAPISSVSLAPLRLIGDGDVYGNDRFVGRRYSYHKLPQQLFKLSILKLDGTSFDVHVGRNASVAELKLAVEEVFASSPKEGQGKISWAHVWGHFCLSYEGQKLINDKACIQTFGIKDDDQIQFVRHLSINYSNSKRQSRNQKATHKPYSTVRPLSRDEEKEQRTFANHSDNNENQDYDSKYHCEDHDDIPTSEFKLAHFLREWLSRKGSQGQSRPSRFSLQCLGGGPRMIELQG
ncbi:hypothetical protein P3X46_010855 [Hevea brasiliensis]|uniref:SNRNP25 ubiquitin-like domain-containing protein n=1 Tax=Hevea brasiliensis TaxID=3981 RepID=A0ABQ9MFF9_HEVBR|nr:uncharacterized protein LOC110658898 [Hevea brasiliensis]KAJ9179026.1 hypothetical protein P3X46_010855 [Hevea brasiliensis]